jgi:hypothetical protein
MSGALITEQHKPQPPEIEAGARPTSDPIPSRSIPHRTSVLILCFAGALYLALSIHLLRAGIAATGQLTYPLDDTYITMAMAKNLAFHGVWGITRSAFAPSSSCPGFLLILAAVYRLTGPTVWAPLALSLGFGLLAIFAAWRILRELNLATQICGLLAFIIFTPLHVLGLLGMEHTLHLALILLFLDLAGRALAAHSPLRWTALLLTAFMVSVRYESLFIVAVAGLLLLGQRRIRAAISLGIAAAAPVAIYGVASVLHGGYWLPNSIALKGTSTTSLLHAPIDLLRHFESCIVRAPHMGALLGAMIALLAVRGIAANTPASVRSRVMLDLVLGATMIHLALADVDWVYRYEAYLIGAAVVAIAFALPRINISRDRWAVAAVSVFGLAAIYFLSARTLSAQSTLPERSVAVYSQQIQMARFLNLYETGASIAANDVGAINYYADINCLDLVGLADSDVFRLKRHGLYTTANLANLAAARNVQIAIVYDSWFNPVYLNHIAGPPLPSSWIRVARWRTPNGEYLGSAIVSFYAADDSEAAKLKRDLALFEPTLPPGVQAIGGDQFFPRPQSNEPVSGKAAR